VRLRFVELTEAEPREIEGMILEVVHKTFHSLFLTAIQQAVEKRP
jgi:hypothetical protein